MDKSKLRTHSRRKGNVKDLLFAVTQFTLWMMTRMESCDGVKRFIMLNLSRVVDSVSARLRLCLIQSIIGISHFVGVVNGIACYLAD